MDNWQDGDTFIPVSDEVDSDPDQTDKDRLIQEAIFTLKQFNLTLLAKAVRYLRMFPYLRDRKCKDK